MSLNSQKTKNELLFELTKNAWAEFAKLKKNGAEYPVTINNQKANKKISEIIVPTMPILYFGDYNAYEESNIKL